MLFFFFLFPPFLSLFFLQDDSLEHRSFIGFLCLSRKIKPYSLLCYPYHLSRHPEGTPGSCCGWTLAPRSPHAVATESTRAIIGPLSWEGRRVAMARQIQAQVDCRGQKIWAWQGDGCI